MSLMRGEERVPKPANRTAPARGYWIEARLTLQRLLMLGPELAPDSVEERKQVTFAEEVHNSAKHRWGGPFGSINRTGFVLYGGEDREEAPIPVPLRCFQFRLEMSLPSNEVDIHPISPRKNVRGT